MDQNYTTTPGTKNRTTTDVLVLRLKTNKTNDQTVYPHFGVPRVAAGQGMPAEKLATLKRQMMLGRAELTAKPKRPGSKAKD